MKQIFERLALCAVRENGRGARRFLSSTRGVKRGRRDCTQYFPIKLRKKLDFGVTNVTHRGRSARVGGSTALSGLTWFVHRFEEMTRIHSIQWRTVVGATVRSAPCKRAAQNAEYISHCISLPDLHFSALSARKVP